MMVIVFVISMFNQVFMLSDCTCGYPIFYLELSRTIEPPCELPSLIQLDEPGYSNTLTILDCNGSATYISTDIGKGETLLNLRFSGAETLTIDSLFTYDENTYQETLTVEKYYRIIVSTSGK